MSTAYHEYEFLPELELELELGEQGELEQELEGELEAEQFFGQLAALARRAASSPALRRIGAQAARAALDSFGEGEEELEGELEMEGESSRDGLYSPYRKVYVDALMEHMGHQAAEAETEDEAAEAFLPLIPMLAAKIAPLAIKAAPMLGKMAGKVAGKLAPKVFSNVMKVAPRLTKGIGNIARTLHRNPKTRQLLRAVPQIARRTTADIARRVARGGSVNSRVATRSLARQTAQTLGSPKALTRIYRRGRRLDRSAHGVLPAGRAPRRRRALPAASPGMMTRAASPGMTRAPAASGGLMAGGPAPGGCGCNCGPAAAPAVCPTCGR